MLAGKSSRGFLPRFAALLERNVCIKPLANRRQVRLREIALQQPPHARLESSISGLVVALPQSREDTENSAVPLGRKCPIGARKIVAMTGRGHVAVDHCTFDVGRNIAPCILQHRREVVGGMASKRVLEIEQSK